MFVVMDVESPRGPGADISPKSSLSNFLTFLETKVDSSAKFTIPIFNGTDITTLSAKVTNS